MQTGRKLLLDVGGTFIKGAVFDTASRSFLSEFEVGIDSDGSADSICSSLRVAFARGGEVSCLAVAIPGPFDFGSGIFRMKHKFASVYGLSFREILGVDIPMTFIHDVNCVLRGELAVGAARGYDNVALVTLGTGLGFTLSRGGEILVAPSGSPAVGIYNLPYRDGILEDYVSKRGLLRLYGELGGDAKDLTVKDMADAAYSGDALSASVFARAGEILCGAVEGLLCEYGTECLLLGGQISRSFSLFEPALQPLPDRVPSLKRIARVSDISRACFNGLSV
ncbi:MAG: ROK family protein [Bacteroidales bacterium]|nr:ROK family protein [Bacteroidales bacterium]